MHLHNLFLILIFLIEYYCLDYTKGNVIGGACFTNGADEKCIPKFSQVS
jgi:hypothetical protein